MTRLANNESSAKSTAIAKTIEFRKSIRLLISLIYVKCSDRNVERKRRKFNEKDGRKKTEIKMVKTKVRYESV